MKRRLSASLGAVVLAVLVAGGDPSVAQDKVPAASHDVRLALVVGEAAYAFGPLPVSANDAGLVAQALSQVGFEVTARADLDAAALRTLAQEFADKVAKAGPDAFVVVYLAGAGVQYADANFVLPVGADVTQADDIPAQAVALDSLLHPLEALPARARLFIADLARQPFPAGRDLPLAAGLALHEPSTAGTLTAFNAMPGTLAPADAPPYGAYARALAAAIDAPGTPIGTLMERVRLRVGAATNGAVVPWNAGTLDEGTTFVPPVAREAAEAGASYGGDVYSSAIARDTLVGYEAALKAAPNGRQAPRLRTILASLREARFWSEAAKADVPRAYWTYLRRYPRGAHLFDARRRLALLKAPLEPPPRFDIMSFDAVPAPTPEEAALVAAPFALLTNPAWPPIPAPADLPPVAAGFADLPPPPLALAGVLPIPLPPAHAGGVQRRILQPNVPLYGAVASETRGGAAPSLVVLANGKPLYRVATIVGPSGDRTVTETDAAGAVVSRTTSVRRHGELAIVQTGPDGGTLTTAVTRTEQDGARRTTITDGRKDMVAEVRTDEGGVAIATTLGAMRDVGRAFKPAAGPGQAPTLPPTLPPHAATSVPSASPPIHRPPIHRPPSHSRPSRCPLNQHRPDQRRRVRHRPMPLHPCHR